jgi:alpha-methylacyl-CoA racemase
MTGWGQDGPLAQAAGHDLNYLAVTGALSAIGRRGHAPTPPLNLVGDYGGGALYLALGIACALLERNTSGKGQVVDAAIVDGAASLMTAFFGLHAAGLYSETRGENILDSGAYFYEVYECADERWISVAPIEGKFHSSLLDLLGIKPEGLPEQMDRKGWSLMRELLEKRFKEKTRDEWCSLLEGSDACVAPVLTIGEAPHHAHLRARNTFVKIDNIVQPRPAPRFSRSVPRTPTAPYQHVLTVEQALSNWHASNCRA